jgi:hypothetical protein
MVATWRTVFSAFSLCALAWLPAGYGAEEAGQWRLIENKMRIAAGESTEYDIDGDEVNMANGAVLLEPMANTTIKLRMVTVNAKSKSLVFVRSRKGCEHVLVLLGNATAAVGRHRVGLSSGDEAIVTDHHPNYHDLVGEDEIGRRRCKLVPASDGRMLAVTEFSLIHALEREPLIYQLIHSDQSRDRALKDRLIKTAAVLSIVTAKHGQYSTGRQ